MTNVKKVTLDNMSIYHTNGLVTIAKCAVTGKFIKRAKAQAALNLHLSDSKLKFNIALLSIAMFSLLLTLLSATGVTQSDYSLDMLYNAGNGFAALNVKAAKMDFIFHVFGTLFLSSSVGIAIRSLFK